MTVTDKFGKIKNVTRSRENTTFGTRLYNSQDVLITDHKERQNLLNASHFTTEAACRMELPGVDRFVPIVEEEYELILANVKNKAPGPDGIYVDLWKLVYFNNKDYVLELLNTCLRLNYFPSLWKRAIVVYLNKKKLEMPRPEHFRPICLLSTLGKTFDRVLAQRLSNYLEVSGAYDEKQYGFRKNRSTMEALRSLIEFSKKDSRPTAVVSLDLRNAFNSVRYDSIINSLIKYEVPSYLISTISSFLTNRAVLNDDGSEFSYNIGVPQGSCLGPILFNAAINCVLLNQVTEDFKLQAFADDLVVIFKISAPYLLSRVAEPVLRHIFAWAESNYLSFNLAKCKYTFFRGKKKIKSIPPLRFENVRFLYDPNLVYLGIMFDQGLTFIDHLNNVKNKLTALVCKFKRICTKTWGLKKEVLKVIYLRVLERVILYGHPIWYSDKVKIRQKLGQLQRICLLTVTSCYATISTEAVQVLAGCLPLDLQARMKASLYRISKWRDPEECIKYNIRLDDLDLYTRNNDIMKRLTFDFDRRPVYEHYYYTDGSKYNDAVGAAYVGFVNGTVREIGKKNPVITRQSF